MSITCFKDLTVQAGAMPEKTIIAVVEAQDEHTIESVIQATTDEIIQPVLIGDAEKIRELLARCGADFTDFDIINAKDAEESLEKAVKMIHSGSVGALMKGNVDSTVFMKAVVSRKNGLLTNNRLSHAALFETPAYHKMFAVSDIVVNTYPDFECKRAIIENAVGMLNSFGNQKLKRKDR